MESPTPASCSPSISLKRELKFRHSRCNNSRLAIHCRGAASPRGSDYAANSGCRWHVTRKVTALERDAARLVGERGALVSGVAQARGRITETELQILQI